MSKLHPSVCVFSVCAACERAYAATSVAFCQMRVKLVSHGACL